MINLEKVTLDYLNVQLNNTSNKQFFPSLLIKFKKERSLKKFVRMLHNEKIIKYTEFNCDNIS